ncbi:MAG: SRPBCC domain-containing protein [Planctomycetota bacterium]
MTTATATPAQCHKYELEIEINAPRDAVWKAIFEDTNMWWLPDFHVAGPRSTVTFDPQPGGSGLLELTPDGGGLLWYTVQMHLPADYKIYLAGHVAPDWGGPCTSMLALSLIETENGCVLQVSDARHGNVDESSISGNQSGWTTLFTDGLKSFVEGSGD